MNTITQLEQMLMGKNWQKFCATEDWQVPEFKFVVKEIFKNSASYHRKQWEFIVIFLNLVIEGKLHNESRGASFGAGKEPLIYVLLPFVKSFLATDLYSWSTGWDTARLGERDTPHDFLKRHAPENLNIDNLDALEMDMRTLDIEDSSLDFCYSSCAVEHIGHRQDFLQHLREVKRVLKDDGVYVMTTELLFNHVTVANKGNYKFDIPYLQALFLEAGLNTKPLFDASCEDSRLNTPRPFVRPFIGGKNMEKILPAAAILDIEGVAYTSCCFILTKSHSEKAVTFKETGLEQSSEFIKRKMANNILNMFADKRSLDPFYSLKKHCRLYLDDHMKFRVEKKNEKPSVTLKQANFSFTDFIWFNNKSASFEISYSLNSYKGRINWILVEKEQMKIKEKRRIDTTKVNHKGQSGLHTIKFEFQAQKNKVYAIIGQVSPKALKKKDVALSIQYLNISACLIK